MLFLLKRITAALGIPPSNKQCSTEAAPKILLEVNTHTHKRRKEGINENWPEMCVFLNDLMVF